MANHIENNNDTVMSLLSEQEKAQRGWDMPSFARRMKKRLNKIRGEQNETSESFLSRHHYYTNSNTFA